jgi:thiamine monophosphate kinase
MPNKELSTTFRPTSMGKIMRKLKKDKLIHSSIDNSDGLLPSINQIALSSAHDIRINIPPDVLGETGLEDFVDSRTLCLGWGDWNTIITFNATNKDRIKKISRNEGVRFTIIGDVIEGTGNTSIDVGGKYVPTPRIESERFTSDSWMTYGIESYIELLISANEMYKASL